MEQAQWPTMFVLNMIHSRLVLRYALVSTELISGGWLVPSLLRSPISTEVVLVMD